MPSTNSASRLKDTAILAALEFAAETGDSAFPGCTVNSILNVAGIRTGRKYKKLQVRAAINDMNVILEKETADV